MSGGNYIVHLSDLHFGGDHGFLMPGDSSTPGKLETDIADAVIADLLEQRIEPSEIKALIISGDLMTHARWVEHDEAAFRILVKLCDGLQLDRKQVYIVPGNHDYEWYAADAQGKMVRKALSPERADAKAIRFGHVVHFDSFLTQFYEEKRPELPCVHTIELPSYTLKLGLLDSCKLVATKFHEYGYLSLGQIKSLMRAFDDDRAKREVRAIVLHHHLNSVIPAEPPPDEASVSITLDAARLIDQALTAGVSFVLHGHQHYPCISKFNKSHPNKESALVPLADEDLYVLSSGSTGVRRDRLPLDVPNTYSLISMKDGGAIVRIRQISSSGATGKLYLEKLIPLKIIE